MSGNVAPKIIYVAPFEWDKEGSWPVQTANAYDVKWDDGTILTDYIRVDAANDFAKRKVLAMLMRVKIEADGIDNEEPNYGGFDINHLSDLIYRLMKELEQ